MTATTAQGERTPHDRAPHQRPPHERPADPAGGAPYHVATGGEVELFARCHARGLAALLKGPTGCGEARARGVLPHCLTVDREEPEYLPHVFGAAGHTVLRRADQLPLALVGVVRQLLGAGRA